MTYIVYGHTASGNDIFKFGNSLFLICSKDYREGRIILPECKFKKVFYEALKMMYDLATAGKDTLHVHAAVVSCGGKGYLFLGPSGTGKSTHAQLWLKHFEGTELVNDERRGGLWFALERHEDALFQECQRPHWRHCHAEPGSL